VKKEIVIVGGGSAGFGAAYRALKHGDCSVTLIEKNSGLGGTSTYGGVNCWEPGVGGNGIHREIAAHLENAGLGFVGESVGEVNDATPWGHSVRSESPYEETLIRGDRGVRQQRRFHFEPKAMEECMLSLLRQTDTDGRLSLLFNSEVHGVATENGRIVKLIIKTPEGQIEKNPELVIDCSAEIAVARAAGCETAVGEDAFDKYNEPHAPENPQRLINGLSRVFRVTPTEKGYIEPVPEEYRCPELSKWVEDLESGKYPLSCFNDYPNGDINVNMLPTIGGEAWLDMPHDRLDRLCIGRAYAYWNWLGRTRGVTGYKIASFFPMPGIRESYRLVGKYVLTENDLFTGYATSLGAGHSIAFADHPADLHGKTNKSGGMTTFGKYGIPYECLLPKEINNLIVACRGASFSHIAASSARLNRTMIALGEAAGIAAAECVREDIKPADVKIENIRRIMGITEA